MEVHVPNPPRQITIAQVAEYAGVSQASVSRVLNRNQTVDPAISAKVRDAIEKLNYSPSQMARNLVRGRSNTVALVVPDLENPMFQGVLKGLSREAALDGYRVLVADTAERVADEEEIALEARSRCDALVLVSPRMPAERLEALLARSGPIVVVNRPVASDPAAELSVDYEHAVGTLGEHLVSLGHARIAYLSGPPQSYADGLRRRGLAQLAARHAGLEVQDIAGGSQVEDGYRAAEDVLSAGATAVIAFNDLVALGLLARLRELGVDVPGEISVAGIDDIPLAKFAAPALTTMSVPRVELGAQSWRRLRDAMAGAPATHPLSYRAILEARGSTGPAPEAAGWLSPGRPVLRIGDRVVARYEEGTSIDSVLSPRPFLHPVETLGGVKVTDSHPTDHLHHFGIGVALPDVNGTSYWGGRTYVQDVGSIMLENQGMQRRDHLAVHGDALVERLTWIDEREVAQLSEVRILTGRVVRIGERDAWTLGWRSTLAANFGALTFGSPATNGRQGAGYGGVFWRFPRWDATVVTRDGVGEAAAHGSQSPWLAVADAGRRVTVLLAQPDDRPALPWFARVGEYLGIGPAVAWDALVEVAEGGTLELGLDALLIDRVITDPDELERLAGELGANANAVVEGIDTRPALANPARRS
jgi:LacI family transcriptional regulator